LRDTMPIQQLSHTLMPAADYNIVLIGYRGAGKTSVARELSARLGWPWYDSDTEIERAAGKSIAEIFATGGEALFRDWESRVIEQLGVRRGVIIATGGGAILRAENRAMLTRAGRFVWLQADPETIHARLQADATTAARRPNLTRLGELEEIRTLLAEREPIYAALAELRLNADANTAAELAETIAAALTRSTTTEAT